jgi:predicted membrane channel-forming protein YqfA (hemolysin III family)
MANIKRYTVPALVAVYFAAHHAQHFGWGPEVFRFYAKDFLLVPLLLCASVFVMGIFKKSFAPGTKEIVLATVYAAIAFEVILPNFGTNFAPDLADILCYTLGALFYGIFLKDTEIVNTPLTTC